MVLPKRPLRSHPRTSRPRRGAATQIGDLARRTRALGRARSARTAVPTSPAPGGRGSRRARPAASRLAGCLLEARGRRRDEGPELAPGFSLWRAGVRSGSGATGGAPASARRPPPRRQTRRYRGLVAGGAGRMRRPVGRTGGAAWRRWRGRRRSGRLHTVFPDSEAAWVVPPGPAIRLEPGNRERTNSPSGRLIHRLCARSVDHGNDHFQCRAWAGGFPFQTHLTRSFGWEFLAPKS